MSTGDTTDIILNTINKCSRKEDENERKIHTKEIRSVYIHRLCNYQPYNEILYNTYFKGNM
jgi:hypothetical protein